MEPCATKFFKLGKMMKFSTLLVHFGKGTIREQETKIFQIIGYFISFYTNI